MITRIKNRMRCWKAGLVSQPAEAYRKATELDKMYRGNPSLVLPPAQPARPVPATPVAWAQPTMPVGLTKVSMGQDEIVNSQTLISLLITGLSRTGVADKTIFFSANRLVFPSGKTYYVSNSQFRGAYGAVHLAKDIDGNKFVIKVVRDEQQSSLPPRAAKENYGGAPRIRLQFDNEGSARIHLMTDLEVTQYEAARARRRLDSGRKTQATPSESLTHEITAMRQINGPMRVLDATTTLEGKTLLVMPYRQGDLLHFLHQGRAPTAALGWQLLADGLEQLSACHAAGYLHRDVKPENFLCDAATGFSLADFGLATQEAGQKLQGTPGFLPDEALQPSGAQQKSDLWALGVTVAVFLHGRVNPFAPPKDSTEWIAAMRQINEGYASWRATLRQSGDGRVKLPTKNLNKSDKWACFFHEIGQRHGRELASLLVNDLLHPTASSRTDATTLLNTVRATHPRGGSGQQNALRDLAIEEAEQTVVFAALEAYREAASQRARQTPPESWPHAVN